MNLSKITKNSNLGKNTLNYKDIDSLKKFINDQGKILSRRNTGLNSKQQKQLTKSVKRARILALLPFLKKE
uniref:Small ribosomal subunit protein bS18c n=1 Tax=Bostrychia moritziana TaxID=103713 RepID=A0A1Z1M7D0_BOSMO|nr:ribosomal protein S18 [Bostrychia moritziana]ARW61664.1 ribosomal protein S18 [Bostrychia moritziana]